VRPSTGIAIRSARVADLLTLAAIDADAFGPASEHDIYGVTTLRQLHDLFPDLLVVAAEAGEVVAYAAAGLASDGATGWILSVVVSPLRRGNGTGGRLVEELIGRLQGLGALTIRASVHPENPASLRMLARRGLVTVARDAEYFGPGQPRLVVGAALGAPAAAAADQCQP